MSKLTRRQMLEQSMFAAALAATAGGTHRAALAWQGSDNASEKLGAAIIGAGGRGGSHIDECLQHKIDIVAICDADEKTGQSRCDSIEKKQGHRPAFYKDIRKCLEDKNVDFTSIATPNHWHALAAIWSVQAGKDVYVEKPVSHNVSEGRRIVQAARKYGKIVQTGTQCRSAQGSIDGVEFAKSGKIGEVKLARGLCYKRRPSIGAKGNYDVPASVDYDLWCGPAPLDTLTRPKLHYDWHWAWATGNGDLGNQGIHQMDVCRWGLGVNDLGNGVLSYGGRLGYEDAGETANTQVCVFDYGDKRLVFEVRGLPTESYRGANVGCVFHGSEGYVVLTSYNGGAAFDKDGNEIAKFNGGGDHYGNFLKAIETRKHTELNADIEEGHLSSALCHLGNISYRLGTELSARDLQERLGTDPERQETFERFSKHLTENKVDLGTAKIALGPALTLDGKQEVFTGELADKANPMLTREYRAPYIVPAADKL